MGGEQLCRGREGRSNYCVDDGITDIFIFHSDSGQYFIKTSSEIKNKRDLKCIYIFFFAFADVRMVFRCAFLKTGPLQS